jgi:hypothetical protein
VLQHKDTAGALRIFELTNAHRNFQAIFATTNKQMSQTKMPAELASRVAVTQITVVRIARGTWSMEEAVPEGCTE